VCELSPEIKRLLREFKKNQQREATEEDLRKILEPLIPESIEEESVFIRKARIVLEKPKKAQKPVQKQEAKLKEKKLSLSPLQRAFVWFTTKIEEVRQQVEGLKERLTKGHGSGVNADKVDDLHAQEIAQRALDIMQAGKGGGIYAGFDKYTDAEAVAAVEAESSLSLSGFLDLPEITPPANPDADTLRLYVEDFKGFPFFSFRDTTGMVRKLVRDSVFVGKNVTGTEIPANRAVYAVGSVEGVPSIGKARANAAATMPAIGVTLEAIAHNAFGRIMQVGLVENVDTSAFAAGNVLYVSAVTAGILVATAPTHPNIPQEIGTILVSDAAVGSVQVVARSMFNYATAVAAVEAEPTLDLTGVIPDSAYPNALLLGGSREMTGHLIPASSNLYYVGTSSKVWEGGYIRKVYATTWNTIATPASIIVYPTATGTLNFLGGVGGSVVARVYGASFEIPLAGDITMLNFVSLKVQVEQETECTLV